MEDKNSFVSNLPFAQRNAYIWWLKLAFFGLFCLVVTLSVISVKNYLTCQSLFVQKNSLLGNVSQLDEIVNKKNKLLSKNLKTVGYNQANRGIHSKIAGFLTEIEGVLAEGLHLDSFEFFSNKIELTGYSQTIENLSETVARLQQLSFVKDHEIVQVSKDVKAHHKLAFTVILNL